MDKNFSFSQLLQMQGHENRHKIKPTQFVSTVEGVKRRFETNVKNRRITRLSSFDNFRNLPNSEPPAPIISNKVEQRRLQLQKWKEEKEKKKKEALAHKKKPFVIGVPKNPLNYVPPPPPRSVTKPMPSTSGSVTRSQSAKAIKCNQKSVSYKEQKLYLKSFATASAKFNPDLKDLKKTTLEKIVEDNIQSKIEKAPKQEQRNLRSRVKIHNADSKKKMIIHSDRESSPYTMVTNAMEKSIIQVLKSKKQQKISPNLTKTKSKKNTITKSITITSSSSLETDLDHKLTKTKPGKKSKQARTTRNSKKTSKILLINNNSASDVLIMDTEVNKKTPTRQSKGRKKSVDTTVINTTIEDFITFTPAKSVPKSESSSEERLRSPKAVDVPKTPQQIEEEIRKTSPRVCVSRGKDNARNEMKKRIDDGLLDDDVCDMTVEHFRRQLDSEIKRMTQMCDEWSQISEQLTLPDPIQEAVLAAVGQARLLMSQKMQQFSSLLSRCERPEPGSALVTHGDLQGFWDMVFMQVVNIDLRFKKLEECRDRGWVEEQLVSRVRKPAAKPAVRPARLAASSRIKEAIAAARKAKKEQPASDQAESQPATETKTFEAGFFSVQSPVKSAILSTPTGKQSLLKAVLSSEAKKASSRRSSLAMLRASSISKDIDKEESLPYTDSLVSMTVNLTVTPGRSILKANNNSIKKEHKKSIKVVLFDDTAAELTITETNDCEADISGVEILRDPVEQKEGKENRQRSRRNKLVRQDAVDDSKIMTRSRRRSTQTPVPEKTGSRSKQTLQEVNVEEKTESTPGRSRRRRNLSENV